MASRHSDPCDFFVRILRCSLCPAAGMYFGAREHLSGIWAVMGHELFPVTLVAFGAEGGTTFFQ